MTTYPETMTAAEAAGNADLWSDVKAGRVTVQAKYGVLHMLRIEKAASGHLSVTYGNGRKSALPHDEPLTITPAPTVDARDFDMALMDDEEGIPDPISDALTGEDWEQLSKDWAQQRLLSEYAVRFAALRAQLAEANARELAYLAAARSLLFELGDCALDEMRGVWGNTNTGIIINWRDKLREAISAPSAYADAVLKEYADYAKRAREADKANARADAAEADAAVLRAALERVSDGVADARSLVLEAPIKTGDKDAIDGVLVEVACDISRCLAQTDAGAALLAERDKLRAVAEAARKAHRAFNVMPNRCVCVFGDVSGMYMVVTLPYDVGADVRAFIAALAALDNEEA